MLFGHQMNDVRIVMAKKEDRPERKAQGAGNSPRGEDEPAATLDTRTDLAKWVEERPATTVVSSFRPDVIAGPGFRGAGDGPRQDAPGSVRVTVEQAATLQTFAPDYPWQGLAVPQHIAAGLEIEHDQTVINEAIRDLQQRRVRFTMRFGAGQDSQVLDAVVIASPIDVVNDLARLRAGHYAVLRHGSLAALHDVAARHVGGVLGSASVVRVESVTVEPPLLPMLSAESPSDRFAFAVITTWLGWAPGESELGASTFVVHDAHALGCVLPVASLNLADSHMSTVLDAVERKRNAQTKQFEQIGNAVPPLLAFRILESLLA